jgi:hypothetical protein
MTTKYQVTKSAKLKNQYMQTFIICCLVATVTAFTCSLIMRRSKSDGVDDEYSRGFFNAMAIMQERMKAEGLKSTKEPYKFWPYWDECKKSYANNQDLYNYWDNSYLENVSQMPPKAAKREAEPNKKLREL